MQYRTRYILLVLSYFFLSINSSHAQNSEKDIRAKINAQLNKIYLAKEKSLGKENKNLMNYMVAICSHLPATLHMNFTGIKDDFYAVNSDDEKVRAYFWSTLIERSVFDVLLQFQVGDSVGVSVWNSASGRKKDEALGIYTPSKIISVHTTDNKTVYLVISDVRIGASTQAEQIQAFAIEGYELNEIPFFQTKKDTLSTITYNYDPTFNNNYDVNSFIHLSQDKQKLYIPLIVAGTLKKTFLVYAFNGNNYVFDKNAK